MDSLPRGWIITTLGDISENVMYGMNAKAISFDGKHKYIRITDIDEDTNKFRPNPLTSPNGSVEHNYKLIEGDLVFARTGASVGKPYLYDKNDGELYFAGFLIRFHIADHVPYFIFLQTQIARYQNWVKSVSMRSGQPGINAEEFKKLPIAIAPKKEQIMISDTMRAWDTAIEKTEALIAAKEQQFQWLMATLISSQRYNEISLEQAGYFYTGLSGKSKDDFGLGKPYIPYLNIFSNSSVDPKHLDYVDIRNGEKQNLVKKGDVFFTVSSETPKEVGMSSILLEDISNCYLNSFCFGWRCTTTDIVPGFLRYYFRSSTFRKQVVKLSQGATRFNLSKSQLMKAHICYPSIKEQNYIAKTLNTACRELDLLKELTEQYRTQKCGLMQKLLTGKWRMKL